MLKHALPSGVVEEPGGRVWRVSPDNASEVARVLRLASELGLSAKTVSTYRSRVLRKLGMKNNAELMRFALREGLVE